MCNVFAVAVQTRRRRILACSGVSVLSAQPINKSVCDGFCLECAHLFLSQSRQLNVAYIHINQNLIRCYDCLLCIYLIMDVWLCPYNVLDQAIKPRDSIWSNLTRLVSFNWLALACLQTPRLTLSLEGKQCRALHALHVQHYTIILPKLNDASFSGRKWLNIA